MTSTELRREHDLLGDFEVPGDVYYGVHTARALENFPPITGMPIARYPELIVALACVKLAAARANHRLGLLSAERTDAIVAACREIKAGALHDQFVVDVIQGGAGTSTNMNANEVIANRGLELLGHRRGDYAHLHPLEHVNLGAEHQRRVPDRGEGRPPIRGAQTAIGHDRTGVGVRRQGGRIREPPQDGPHPTPGRRTDDVGSGVRQLRIMVGEDADRLGGEANVLIAEINLGGTAIGTGLNAHLDYAGLVCEELRAVTELPLVTASNLVEATQDVGAFVQLSGVLKRTAVKLSKICNDLRLLSSGPAPGSVRSIFHRCKRVRASCPARSTR